MQILVEVLTTFFYVGCWIGLIVLGWYITSGIQAGGFIGG